MPKLYKINLFLSQGWDLQGSPSIAARDGAVFICQAMTKTTWVKK